METYRKINNGKKWKKKNKWKKIENIKMLKDRKK